MWVGAGPEGSALPPPVVVRRVALRGGRHDESPGCRPATATPRRMRRRLAVTLEWRDLPPGRQMGPPGRANFPRSRSEEPIRVPSARRLRRPAGREAGLTRSSLPVNRSPSEGCDRGLSEPGSSSQASTPASVRLRRFSRPWRFTPLRALRRVSAGHAPGVRVPSESPVMGTALAARGAARRSDPSSSPSPATPRRAAVRRCPECARTGRTRGCR